MSNEEQVAKVEASLTEEESAFLDRLADKIVARRLTSAVLFFLESMKPLGFIGSQLLYFFQPMVNIIWSEPMGYERLAKILERRGSIEVFLRRIESRAE